MASSSSSANNAPAPGLKTHFKTPEGRYKLQQEKTHQPSLIHYTHGKTAAQVTLANLKEKPAGQAPVTPTSGSNGGMRLATRIWGIGNGSRAFSSLIGGNVVSKVGGASGGKMGFGSSAMGDASGVSPTVANYDGKGTYLLFNVGDVIFISDFNSPDMEPIKSIHFSSSNPMCHAFDADAKEGHDMAIGFNSGDVYTVSLRHQLQDTSRKLVGAQHYNKEGIINNSRCTSVAWVPGGDGVFVVAYADGNLYVYDKAKDGAADSTFSMIKDQTQFTVSHAKSNKNPIARWHICQGSINNISFSADGSLLATVGRDGYLRVFDFAKEQLICGCKSYYGALLCCAWSPDGKYILTGGEDDLVQVWSMDDRKIVAWGEGHNSWVSAVTFDSYWSAPSEDDSAEDVVYRFGSVGQDTQLLLWDLVMDELVVPIRRPPGGSPTTLSSGSPSVHWDNISPVGTLQPASSVRDVPKLSPLVVHRSHMEPLSGLVFTSESMLTICREGFIKIWSRPGCADSNQSSTPDAILNTSLPTEKGKTQLPAVKPSSSLSYKAPPILG